MNSTVIHNENLKGTRNLTQQDIQKPSHFINEEIVQTTTTTQQSISPIRPNLTTPMATTNSVNFQTNSHPPQDRSENYPFFQQNKDKKQAPHQTDYLSSDDDYLQPDIFAPYTQEYRGQGVQKPHTYHGIFSPHPIDTQNQQPIQMQNPINTQSFQTNSATKPNDYTLVSTNTKAK